MRSAQAQAAVWPREEHRTQSQAGGRRGEEVSASGQASGPWLLCVQLHLLAPKCGAWLLLLLTDSTRPPPHKDTRVSARENLLFHRPHFYGKEND